MLWSGEAEPPNRLAVKGCEAAPAPTRRWPPPPKLSQPNHHILPLARLNELVSLAFCALSRFPDLRRPLNSLLFFTFFAVAYSVVVGRGLRLRGRRSGRKSEKDRKIVEAVKEFLGQYVPFRIMFQRCLVAFPHLPVFFLSAVCARARHAAVEMLRAMRKTIISYKLGVTRMRMLTGEAGRRILVPQEVCFSP